MRQIPSLCYRSRRAQGTVSKAQGQRRRKSQHTRRRKPGTVPSRIDGFRDKRTVTRWGSSGAGGCPWQETTVHSDSSNKLTTSCKNSKQAQRRRGVVRCSLRQGNTWRRWCLRLLLFFPSSLLLPELTPISKSSPDWREINLLLATPFRIGASVCHASRKASCGLCRASELSMCISHLCGVGSGSAQLLCSISAGWAGVVSCWASLAV
jgi:hypothetical protein